MSLSNRETEILQLLLAQQEITYYTLASISYPDDEEKPLPGSAYPGEIVERKGFVVTPTHIYQFWFNWIDNHYTLGNEMGRWGEADLEQLQMENEDAWLDVLSIQELMPAKPRKPLAPHPLPQRLYGMTAREDQIIRSLLSADQLWRYELFNVQSNGQVLGGSIYPGEVEQVTGLIITSGPAYQFTLDWVEEQYTLGQQTGAWHEVQFADLPEESREQARSIATALARSNDDSYWE
jgi:hypothetical protein